MPRMIAKLVLHCVSHHLIFPDLSGASIAAFENRGRKCLRQRSQNAEEEGGSQCSHLRADRHGCE